MVSRETGFTLQSFLLFIDMNSYDALKKIYFFGETCHVTKSGEEAIEIPWLFFFLIGNILRTQNTGRTSEHPLL